jgi:hypothetical protein
MLRVGLVKPGSLRQANFEASMDYSAKAKDALERIHNAVDAVAAMLAEYFENEEQGDLPLSWKEYPFQGKTVFLQYSTENAELEKQADALLGELDDSLVVDKETEDEDALSVAEVDPSLRTDEDGDEEESFGSDDDEDTDADDSEDEDAEKSPRMFSGTSTKKETAPAPKTKTRKKLH